MNIVYFVLFRYGFHTAQWQILESF